jgi:hypothetical protein
MDIAKFIDELGATGEDRSALEGLLSKNQTVAAKLGEWHDNGLRQSDYSRKMNGWSAEKAAEEARLKAESDRLAAARETMNTEFLKATKEREDALNLAAQLQNRVKTKATEYGVDPALFLDGLAPATPVVAAPASAGSGFTMDQVLAEVMKKVSPAIDVMTRLPNLAVDLNEMDREHHALFGKPLDSRNLLDRAAKENRDYRTVYE